MIPTSAGSQSDLAIILIAGGGYDRLTDTQEQIPVAEYFASRLHTTTYILYYRLVQHDGRYRYPVPMWDGQRAIKVVQARRGLEAAPRSATALFGFSAGGHLASTLALHLDTNFKLPITDSLDRASNQVDYVGLGYPIISMDPAHVPPSGSYRNLLRGYHGAELRELENYLSGENHAREIAPPVFLFESMDDARISPQNSLLFVNALRDAGRSVEAHIFVHGIHGSGLATGTGEESTWPSLFKQWLVRQKAIAE